MFRFFGLAFLFFFIFIGAHLSFKGVENERSAPLDTTKRPLDSTIYLKEVKISDKPFTSIEVGYSRLKTKTFQQDFATSSSQFYGVKIIDTNQVDKLIHKITFLAKSNDNEVYVSPRIYAIDSNGDIGENLIKNNLKQALKNKFTEIDVQSNNIIFPKEGVFVCLAISGNCSNLRLGLAEGNSFDSFIIIDKEKALIPLMMKNKNKALNFQIGLSLID